jgi:predicted CopG family antitoxin
VTKQVAFANTTYKRLRRERRPGESFSQAVDRLLDSRPKDPKAFLKGLRPPVDPKKWLAEVEASRDADRMDL